MKVVYLIELNSLHVAQFNMNNVSNHWTWNSIEVIVG